MKIKEQIRDEIEKRIAANKTKNGFPAGTICAIRIETYEELLAFLDTLPEQPVSDHHEIEVEFRGEKVTISREFYRDGERNYSTSEQDDNAIWSALRAWCEKKGITPFELYPKQPEQPVEGLEETADLLAIAHLQGMEQQKAKMLEVAVEGTVVELGETYKDLSISASAKALNQVLQSLGLEDGDKVRLIIVKEDEK